MRGVLREKVKKKTTARQIIAKVLLAPHFCCRGTQSDHFLKCEMCKNPKIFHSLLAKQASLAARRQRRRRKKPTPYLKKLEPLDR